MSQKNNHNADDHIQKWTPNWMLSVLYRVWRVVFAGLKIGLGAAATVLLIVVACGFAFVGCLGDYLQQDVLPFASLELDKNDLELTSNIYYIDSDGQIQKLQEIFTDVDREYAPFEQIPEALVQAAVAIEDKRFFEHQGVDWITTIKACARMLFGNASAGGSGITQQLIKNVLLTEDETADDVTVQRKVTEIFRAIYVEKNYSKQAIMELYLNTIYLGQGYYGVRSASEFYFGKELEMLTVAECASLISITNNPSIFDPYSDSFTYMGKEMTGKERNRYRQMLVLGEMRNQGWITQEEYDEAVAQEMVFENGISFEETMAQCPNTACAKRNVVGALNTDAKGNYLCPECGTLIPVKEDASATVYSWFVDTVLEDAAEEMALRDGLTWNDNTARLYRRNIQRGGYHIYSTLDMEVQNQVDKIYQDLSQIPDPRGSQQLQSAIVIVDNNTGDIIAMSGGVGDNKGHDDWNRATDAQVQSGSSIKPLSIYAPGFECGSITPATVIDDLPFTYEGGAWPANDDRIYNYSWTIKQAVVDSVNAVATNTLDRIGLDYSYNFVKNKFRISTLVDYYMDAYGEPHTDMNYAPLAMGAQTWGVTVRDMATAYATFANNGVYREGRTFTKIYDSEGKVVLENEQTSEKILSKKTVDYMNYCLVSATASGTGYEAKISGITTAGKTGTTASNKDRWYCGFTGYYTAAVWCGFDTPAVISGISGNPSSQLFKKVLQPLHKGKADIALYDSSRFETVEICRDSGKLATDACKADPRNVGGHQRWASVQVNWDDVPTEHCDAHVMVDYCTHGNGVVTEYCQHFASVDTSVVFTKKGLAKKTQADIDEILLAKQYRLASRYYQDSYVYLINPDGTDGIFYGFNGDINDGIEVPYKVCTVHTQEAWEEYLASQPSNPSQPSEPEIPEVTVPDVTVPDITTPDLTVPENTEENAA